VDGRTFKVVEAAQLANGRCEFLAVAPVVASNVAAAGEPADITVDAEPLPLPYDLPE
jgi:hypothetical protein